LPALIDVSPAGRPTVLPAGYTVLLRIAAKPANARRAISAMIAHSGSVGTGTAADETAPPQVVALTVLESSVTAPFRAKARPVTVAPVVSVMLVSATIFPAKEVVVPSVAELPTCQWTLHAEPLLVMTTLEPLAVVSVVPIWKTQTALGSPPPFSVRAPVS
jgi:hypothetical protein